MSKYQRRKDTNHNPIIQALRDVGAEVKETYRWPAMLDVIVGYRGRIFWADVKFGNGDLTPAEDELIQGFARVGVQLHVWRTPDDALRCIGAIS